MNEIFYDITELPTKSDFRLSNISVLDKIKIEYVNEHKQWMASGDKDHTIVIATGIPYGLIDSEHKFVIKDMFNEIGFMDSEIEFVETTDTHNLWVRLTIY